MRHFMRPLAALVALLGIAIAGLPAQDDGGDITMGAFKGPTAVGLVQVIDGDVAFPDGGSLSTQLVQSPPVMVSRLINGEFQAAVLPVNLAAKLYNAGRPLVLAAVTGNGMLSVLSTDGDIDTLADLAGRTVHVAGQGGTPDYLTRLLLQNAGVEPGSDVTLDFAMAPPEIARSLIAGRIETAVLPEPFATMAVQGSSDVTRRIDLQEAWAALSGKPESYPMTAFVVRADLAESRPDAVATLLDRYESSLAWVTENPAQAAQMAAELELGLPQSVAEAAIPQTNYVFVPASDAREEVEALLSTFLQFAPASIGGSLPDDAFYLE